MPDCAAEVLTEEQITDLERKIGQLPTIKKLKENDNRIIKDLEGLRKGQEELENDVRTGFEKGRKRMDGMEGEMKEIKTLLINSKLDMDRNHTELKEEIRNDKLKRLEDRLEKKDEELKRKKEFLEKIKSGVILIAISSLVGYIAWSFKTVIGKA